MTYWNSLGIAPLARPRWLSDFNYPADSYPHCAFAALAVGGEVRMPLTKTFWSPRFGMVADRFGLGWMISVAA